MKSMCKEMGSISLPLISEEIKMVPFDVASLSGLPDELKYIAKKMLSGIKSKGEAYFTIHGKELKKGQTLRRPGPHTDGNYEPHLMTFGRTGGWKVGENGPAINTSLHDRQYNNEKGGIVLASSFSSCLGWVGEYEGMPGVGGDCRDIILDHPFMLEANKIYYGNNHFIHESLPVPEDTHRVFCRITLPETHQFGESV